MRYLVLVLSVVMLASSAGWAKTPDKEQGRLSVEAHRQEALGQPARHHHRGRHHRHHRHHAGA